MRMMVAAACAAALASPGVQAQSTDEIKALRAEVEALRADYEARLRALEEKLRAAENAAPSRTPPAQAEATSSAGASSGQPANSTQPPAAAAVSSPPPTAAGAANAFNPAIALILSGAYVNASRDPGLYAITGFPLPPDAEIGPGKSGFSLSETELSFAANIDPWLRGRATAALAPDNSVSVEEAFIETTSLGSGLTLKAGRFFSGIGYLNPQHSHTWDFADNPLAYQAMLGTQYGDDGVQLQWLAPTDLYLAVGAELGRGRTYPGGDNNGNGAGMAAIHAHVGGDLGESQSWRAGLSLLNAKAQDQALQFGAPGAVQGVFSGSTRVSIADFVWKWAPNGNATRTSLKVQAEYLRSRRDGDLLVDPIGLASSGRYAVTQSGWYLQGVYQFMSRWRVGLRTERLDPGSPDFSGSGVQFASGYTPSRNTVMVDFNPSEFSRIRLQYARDRAQQGLTDNQLILQYQMSLGAHGAHSY